MDVDGTLTDGKIYMGADGEVFKAFDIKDGYALHTLVKENGIIPIIITARNSPMVIHRCMELGVTEIHQGIMKKLDCLKGILEKYSSADQQYDLSNVAYIGDDLLDLQCMNPIKTAGGSVGCPANAVKQVMTCSDYVSPNKGGEGAVRDYVEYLIERNNHYTSSFDDLQHRCLKAINYLLQLKEDDFTIGRHDVDGFFFYNVQEYETDSNTDKPYESHRKYIDIQLLLSGEEIMQVTDISRLSIILPYDKDKDYVLYSPSDNASGVVLRQGSVMILYPKDGHRTICFGDKTCKVKKVVGKVPVALSITE